MHDLGDPQSTPAGTPDDHRPWYKLLNRYHWFVLAVATMGWMFDCLDQQLFVLARPAAMKNLLAEKTKNLPDQKAVEAEEGKYSNWTTSIFLLGWGCGGLFFGVLGDRIGRARTMLLTILAYSIFTGLSALSLSFGDFSLYRFLTGLGVGGEFAVGVSLVAEVVPAGARSYSLALLQALSAVANMSAAFIGLGLSLASEAKLIEAPPWRLMFVVGAVPALFLALLIWAKLKEPEVWQKVSHDKDVKKKLGSYFDLFRDPMLRRHALFGLVLGCSGIIGLWSVGFFTPDLMRQVQRPLETANVNKEFEAKDKTNVLKMREHEKEEKRLAETYEKDVAAASGQEPKIQELKAHYQQDLKAIWTNPELLDLKKEIARTISARLDRWSSYTSLMMNIGAALGMYGFGILAQRIGRKRTFRIALVSAFVSTFLVFLLLREFWHMVVLVPIMGFCQFSLFAGYGIYFPELFPTRLRSTGTSFCYNVARFVAAAGPVTKTAIESLFAGTSQPVRYAGMAMCGVYLLGLLALPFLPETNGKPLPE